MWHPQTVVCRRKTQKHQYVLAFVNAPLFYIFHGLPEFFSEWSGTRFCHWLSNFSIKSRQPHHILCDQRGRTLSSFTSRQYYRVWFFDKRGMVHISTVAKKIRHWLSYHYIFRIIRVHVCNQTFRTITVRHCMLETFTKPHEYVFCSLMALQHLYHLKPW